MTRVFVLLTTIAALILACRSAKAHAAPRSVILLDLRATDVDAELRLPVPELEAALGRSLAPAENSGANATSQRPLERDSLRIYVARNLHATARDGTAWRVDVGGIDRETDGEGPVVVVHARLTPPTDHSPATFTIENDVIGHEVQNHMSWIGVRSDFAQGSVSGEPTFAGATHYLHHEVLVDRSGGSSLRGFRAMVLLGVRHIAEGTDHLLFVLVLLLPAPLLLRSRARWGASADARVSLRSLFHVVSAFTVGHSLTLIAGTLGWIRLPSAPVETLIAVSILVSAVHAIRPIFPGREAFLAAGFGLVHGLAFAGALSHLHLEGARLGLALLGFNLGVELMQLVVVAMTFPWLVLLSRTRAYAPFRFAVALAAGLAALGWILARTQWLTNPSDDIVARVAAYPMALVVALAAFTLGARLFFAAPNANIQSSRRSGGSASTT